MISNKDIQIFAKLSKEVFAIKEQRSERSRVVLAALIYKGRIVYKGYNNYIKSHPLQPQLKDGVIITKHAEVDCISKVNKKRIDIAKCTLFVIASSLSRKNCTYAISSEPCDGCLEVIYTSGIQRIIHHTYISNVLEIIENSTYVMKTRRPKIN